MRRILCSDWLPEQVTTDNLQCTMGFLLTTPFLFYPLPDYFLVVGGEGEGSFQF